ncbi:MAG: substrate-binding and vWA domain-containing protein [bacterium]
MKSSIFKKGFNYLVIAFFAFVAYQVLFANQENNTVSSNTNALMSGSEADLRIVSGSENKALQPLIEEWAQRENINVHITYQGSVDIYRLLQQGKQAPFDAVWPANHLWIELGDEQKVIKHEKSIMRSPVVLALKKPLAEQLGWANADNVTLKAILDAAKQEKFRLAMTSATQSNSGASTYFGFLYAMAGYPDTLTQAHLDDPSVQEQVKQMLSTVDRSSGSSGWLKGALVYHPERFDAMFNYEAMLIEANRTLEKKGADPLCAIYPQDGLMVADSPLGFIDKGQADKEALFLKLQNYLLSEKVQAEIEETGRRTGLLGTDIANNNSNVWKKSWCLDTERSIASIPIPEQKVIQQALNLYQTDLRKPSLTVWVLDVSGSMAGKGIEGLKQAMTTLLDSQQAQQHLLQAGKQDISYIIPFNEKVLAVWEVKGNTLSAQQTALKQVQSLRAFGGTNLYQALLKALETLEPYANDGTLWHYLPAIVAMSDGRSVMDHYTPFTHYIQRSNFAADIPIHAIAFGRADSRQLQDLTEQSVGRLFDSKGDLADTLRKAKGYN